MKSTLTLLCAFAWGALAALGATGPRLHLAGDSTMADKSPKPPNLERGWGQMLREYLIDPAVLDNRATNGRSTKSFLAEGRWAELLAGVAPGDFVLIQFGHNDEKETSPERYAPARGLYRENLLRFIRDVRARGAEPLLATPICRRKFNEAGQVVDTHGEYPTVVREVATEQKVALLDLTVSTWLMFARLGPEAAKQLMMHVPPGRYPQWPDGLKDDTHLNEEGGRMVAALAVQEMFARHLAVAALFKGNPSAPAGPAVPRGEP